MLKWILLAITLVVAWYIWKDDTIGRAFTEKSVASQSKTDDNWCEVKRMDCGVLTRKLNAIRPGRYFEEAGALLDTSFENMTMLRENNGITFLVTGRMKVMHKQSGPEKGYVTVIFPDGYKMKYNPKGKLIFAK